MDKLIKKVIKTIKNYEMIEEGDKIILAVSGGPDSICLLDILNQIKVQLNISLIVAHVHHSIRGKEANIEARFVRLKSCHLKLPFEQLTVSVPEIAREKNLSIEQAGRIVRYQFFQKLLRKFQAQKIALGHHADDQVETMLMRIIRGCGLRGLRGIPPKRGCFIRPLIECTRAEIEAYCKRRNISYCLDSSNKEPKYLRNKIRQQLIPLLKKEYNPALSKNLLQLQTIINDEFDFWEEITDNYYVKTLKKKTNNNIILDISKLREFPTGIQRLIIRRTLRHLKMFLEDIQFNHIEAIRLLSLDERGEKNLELPGRIKVTKSYQDLIFGVTDNMLIGERKKILPLFEQELALDQENEITNLNIKIIIKLYECKNIDFEKKVYKVNKNETYLDYDLLHFPLKIRNRRPGDRFQPLNSNFFKKVKSYFIDQKIARHKRDQIGLVVDNSNRIVWIAGFHTDNRFKVTNKTKRVLYLKQINY